MVRGLDLVRYHVLLFKVIRELCIQKILCIFAKSNPNPIQLFEGKISEFTATPELFLLNTNFTNANWNFSAWWLIPDRLLCSVLCKFDHTFEHNCDWFIDELLLLQLKKNLLYRQALSLRVWLYWWQGATTRTVFACRRSCCFNQWACLLECNPD